MSLPFSQLVFQSDLLVEEGAFESIDTSDMEAPSLQHLESDPLLLHSSDDLLQPTSSHFDWLQNSGPFMSADAYDDHRYGPSDTDFDRLVNATHDYYDKVPQMDFDNDQAEHSYAYFLPTTTSHYAGTTGGQRGLALQSPCDDYATWGPLASQLNSVPSCSSSSSSSCTSASPTTTVTPSCHEVGAESQPTVPPQQPTEHAGELMACEWRSEEGAKCGWRGARCTVEAHVSAVHVGRGIVKPVCRWDGCQKSFVRRYLLLRHVRCLHCEDKPFACGDCGQRFSLRERMKLHQRVAHGQHLQLKLPKNYEQRLQQPPAAVSMQNTPTEYACVHCGATFPSSAHRRYHVERIHENARFTCEYCNDIFSDRSSLTRHRRRKHRNEKTTTVRPATVPLPPVYLPEPIVRRPTVVPQYEGPVLDILTTYPLTSVDSNAR